MAEDTTGTTVLVNATQDAPMPSAEQKTTESKAEEVALKEVPTQITKEEELPETAAERTKSTFEKVKQDRDQYRDQLREERQRREVVEAAFKSMQPKQDVLPPVVDAEGYVDMNVLTDVQRRAYEAEQRALQAEQQIQGYVQHLENREVFAKHPDLDPTSKSFNQELHNLTSGLLTHAMLNPEQYGGKALTFLEAVETVKKMTGQGNETAKAEGAKEAIEQLTSKEQASLEAVGSPVRRTELQSDLSELRLRSRKSNREGQEAVMERLARLKTQE